MCSLIHLKKPLVTLFLGCLLCYAGKVKTYTGERVDLASYRTYQWLPTKALGSGGIVEDDPRVTPILKDSVNRELAARGLTEVTSGGDLQVSTIVLNSYIPQLEAMIFPTGVGVAPMLYDTPIATMGRYNKTGTLAINLIDTHTQQSAWVGMITDAISDKPGAGIKKIPSATASLFAKYPIKKK
jgi:hypothetical protein